MTAFAQLRALIAAVATAKSAVQARVRFGRASVVARRLGTEAALGELDRARAELRRRGWL